MKRRVRTLALWLLLPVSVVTALRIASAPPKDPVCNGIRLSEWLHSLEYPAQNRGIKPEDLRKLRPNPAPYLAYFIQRVHPWERKSMAAWAPAFIRSRMPASWLAPVRGGSRSHCENALYALTWLGPDAEPALPVLLPLLDDADSSIRDTAGQAINCIGPNSWPKVLETLKRGSIRARAALLRTLPYRLPLGLRSPLPSATDRDKSLIVELLLQGCSDPEPDIQMVCVGQLGNCAEYYIKRSPLLKPAVPPIIHCLEQGKPQVRMVAARALPHFGPDAAEAIPALKQMANDPEPFLRDEATFALSRIMKTLSAPSSNP